MSRSPELLVIFAVGWAAGMAATADAFGLGKELGGLLAGMSLASTRYRDAISSRLSSLRDFLLLFFFINLGPRFRLAASAISCAGPGAFCLCLGCNPMIVLAIMGAMGYRKRTGFLAGLTVAQISEFSLIFMAMGMSLGHVNEEAMGLVTLVGLVTIAVSVYMITWSHRLYQFLEPYLGIFERRTPYRETGEASAQGNQGSHDFIIFGLGRYGSRIGSRLKDQGFRVLGIDFDPEAVTKWHGMGFDAEFGDATDPDFLAHLNLADVRAVVSAVPRERGALTEADPQLALLHGLQSSGYRGKIFLSVQTVAETDDLISRGASVILHPFDDAADYAVKQLIEA